MEVLFLDNDLKSPINGSDLELTDRKGILHSEADGLFYNVSADGKIVPLTSPINGSTLEFTDQNGIMYSEADGLFYVVADNGIKPVDESVFQGIKPKVIDIIGDLHNEKSR